MQTLQSFCLIDTTIFAIFVSKQTTKLNAYLLVALLEKIEFEHSLRSFLISTNIRTTNIFDFASTTTINTLKKSLRIRETSAISN